MSYWRGIPACGSDAGIKNLPQGRSMRGIDPRLAPFVREGGTEATARQAGDLASLNRAVPFRGSDGVKPRLPPGAPRLPAPRPPGAVFLSVQGHSTAQGA